MNLINTSFKIMSEINFFKPHKIIVYSWRFQFHISLLKFFLKNIELIYIIAGRGSLFLKDSKIFKFFLFKIIDYILNKPNKVIFINPTDKNWFEKNFKIFGKTYLISTEGVQLIRKKDKTNRKKNFIFLAD